MRNCLFSYDCKPMGVGHCLKDLLKLATVISSTERTGKIIIIIIIIIIITSIKL